MVWILKTLVLVHSVLSLFCLLNVVVHYQFYMTCHWHAHHIIHFENLICLCFFIDFLVQSTTLSISSLILYLIEDIYDSQMYSHYCQYVQLISLGQALCAFQDIIVHIERKHTSQAGSEKWWLFLDKTP